PEKENPLDVLIGRPPTIPGRRPDIAHLALTCENTNTVLPYVDLVNEILEHFVVNGSLANFTGHDVGPDVTAEELLANPQFVNDAAYALLRDSRFPVGLPFHRPLEALRRYFDHFEVPLPEAMERLRPGDAIDRPGAMTDPAYGWRDILMELLLISRQEYAIFTDSHIPLPSLYGLADSLTDAQLVDELSNAKKLSRRLGLSLEELVAITRTRFVNPHCGLIPKLERLGIDFGTIQAFVDGSLSEADLDARLPADLDAAAYGGDVKAWLRNQAPSIMRLIVLSDPTGSADVCSFDTVELRYALPDFAQNKLDPVEFLKMLRFVRLWRKLGWSIEQTDQALSALYPAAQYPLAADDAATARGKLDAGFGTFLVRLGHLRAIMQQLELTPERDLAELLACWATIDTHGPHSLYRRMFLNPTTLPLGDAFAEDGYGNYLSDPNAKLLDHVAALRAACQLTDGAFDQIVQELGFDATTPLNVAHVSAIFRHGYLARRLRLSVEELLALKRLSGLDPFQPLDLDASASPGDPFGSVRPPAIRFIELAQRIDASPLNVIQWWYHLQHVDLTGRSSPPRTAVLAFAQRLRSDLWRIERDHAVEADPTGEIARSKMALVYGQEAADRFFGLLNASTLFSVTYSHAQPALPGDILAVTDRIAYDDFQKKLSFRGVMTPAEKAAL
ncbi:MAG TPA: PA14 domain-containing protein,virulence plasmid 28 protein, partial [Limnochordia bacterium]